MNKNKLKKVERDRLPWFYKLVLKIPGTDFLESSGGIFWAIIVPIFVLLNVLLCWFLLLCFPFPINVIFTAVTPVAVSIIFIKISLQRFLTWWDSTLGKSHFEWNIEETMQEYLSLLKNKEEKNEQ